MRADGRDRALVRRAGMPARPLVELEGISDRNAALALKGRLLTVSVAEAPLDEGEWLAEDLVGCEIEGLGRVRRIVRAPSCDLLETDPDEVLIPFVRDAIRRIDPENRVIEVDRRFLGLEPVDPPPAGAEPDRPPPDRALGQEDAGEEEVVTQPEPHRA